MAKILLVEDDKSLREIYGVRLLAEGYDIVSAGDGEEALAMAIKERPQLIVSDVMMPKISGFDMLDILRSTTETKDIKVIMMTALSSEDQRQRGEQLGADRYLVKSQVGIEDVVRTVHEVLGDAPIMPTANAFGNNAPSAVPRPAPAGVPPRQDTPVPAPVAVPDQSEAAPAPEVSVTPPVQTPVEVTSPSPVASAPVQTPAQSQDPAQTTSAPLSGPVPMSSTPFPQDPSLTAVPPVPAPVPVATDAMPANPTQPVAPSQDASVPSTTLPQPTAPFSTNRPVGLADRIIQPLERPEDSGEPLASLMDKELSSDEESEEPETPVVTPPAPATPPVPPLNTPQPISPNPSAPQPEDHGIAFEETPRPTS